MSIVTVQTLGSDILSMQGQDDEVAAEEVENREENSVGDEAFCSLPKVYLYILWSTCVHKPLRGH